MFTEGLPEMPDGGTPHGGLGQVWRNVTFEEFKAAPLAVGVPGALLFNRCGATIISIHAMSSVSFFCHFGTFCQDGIGRLLMF